MWTPLKFVAKNPSVSAGPDIARITRFYFQTDAKGEWDSVQNFRSPHLASALSRTAHQLAVSVIPPDPFPCIPGGKIRG